MVTWIFPIIGQDYQYSGNCGTADLVASLKWVKENIANFGGDPDNVTIFGQSGGGCKVLNMFATSEAEGLFDQAVVQSGGEGHIDQDIAKKVTAKTLEILGISDNEVEQLKEVPYDTLDAAATEAQKQVGEELGTSVAGVLFSMKIIFILISWIGQMMFRLW